MIVYEKPDSWFDIIRYLNSDECRKIVKFYSSEDGWANLSYKSYRVRITNDQSIEDVKSIVRLMIAEVYQNEPMRY